MTSPAPALVLLEDGGASVGRRLAEARRRSGQTLDQAAAATRIRRHHLDALERDDVAALPGPVYARGYLRTYAEHLGLEAEPLLAARPGPPTVARPEAAAAARRSLSLGRVAPSYLPAYVALTRPVLAGLGLLLVGLLFSAYAWREVASAREAAPAAGTGPLASAPPVASPPPLPSAAPSAAATAPAATPRQVLVAVRATEQTWLTVTVDGKPAYGGFLAAGQASSFAGQKVKLASGKPSLLVSIGGGDYQPLGVLSKEYSADT